jgi:hypothetical protein
MSRVAGECLGVNWCSAPPDANAAWLSRSRGRRSRHPVQDRDDRQSVNLKKGSIETGTRFPSLSVSVVPNAAEEFESRRKGPVARSLLAEKTPEVIADRLQPR